MLDIIPAARDNCFIRIVLISDHLHNFSQTPALAHISRLPGQWAEWQGSNNFANNNNYHHNNYYNNHYHNNSYNNN